MASKRGIKKDIDYLAQEIISDSYLALHFHPAKQEEIVGLMRRVVDMRNDFFARANHPAEPKNPRLVRKHYAALRLELMEKVDGLFTELSAACRK